MSADLVVEVLTVEELEDAVAVHDSEQGREPGCFRSDEPPAEPGVYVWSTESNRKVLYIGSAANLNKRIGQESQWLSFDPNHDWAESVLYVLKRRDAEVAWVATDTHEEAKQLERRLIEWHRAAVGIAPLAYGWEEKSGSFREAGQVWARDLWNQTRADRTYELLRQFGYQRESELADLSELGAPTIRRNLAQLKSEGRAKPLDDEGLWGAV